MGYLLPHKKKIFQDREKVDFLFQKQIKKDWSGLVDYRLRENLEKKRKSMSAKKKPPREEGFM